MTMSNHPAPFRQRGYAPNVFAAAMNAEIQRLTRRTLMPSAVITAPRPALIKRGDLVQMRATGFYVSKVNADGSIALAESRDAFAEPVTLDRCHPSRLMLVQSGPDEPKVGDTITADELRATPWRRGTLIRFAGTAYGSPSDEGGRYVLASDGSWTCVEDGGRWPFGQLVGRFVIEHAPGKATR